MIPITELEERLMVLIKRFEALGQSNNALKEELGERDRRIGELESRCAGLEQQLDAFGKQRFTVKRLEDERQVLRHQLDAALERLQKLEQEL